MRTVVSSTGVKTQTVTVGISAIVEPPEGERIELVLEDLDGRSGIKVARVSESKEGELCVVLQSESGDYQTLAITSSGVRLCTTGQRIDF